MGKVALFHHAQGLTDGVRAFAAGLEANGHAVHTPDLYDGAVFDDLDAGVANAERIGFLELIEAGRDVVADLPDDLVVAGFSLGALVAHNLAQTRPGVRGAVLIHHGDVPVDMFGLEWPAGVDPWAIREPAGRFRGSASNRQVGFRGLRRLTTGAASAHSRRTEQVDQAMAKTRRQQTMHTTLTDRARISP